MKKLIIHLVVAGIALLNSTFLVAQSGRQELDAGLYSSLKQISSPQSFSVTLVDSRRMIMVLPSGVVSTSIEYISPDNVVISGTIGRLAIQNEGVLHDLKEDRGL